MQGKASGNQTRDDAGRIAAGRRGVLETCPSRNAVRQTSVHLRIDGNLATGCGDDGLRVRKPTEHTPGTGGPPFPNLSLVKEVPAACLVVNYGKAIFVSLYVAQKIRGLG